MGFMGVANNEYLRKALEEKKEKKINSSMSYEELHERLNNIPMINQLKRNYFDNRDSGYSEQTSFQWAKVRTYEEYLEYFMKTVEDRDLKNLKLSEQLRQGFDIIKDEPVFLTQFLEDSRFLISKGNEQ